MSYKIYIHWGFTGTLHGMTVPQYTKVHEILQRTRPGHVHHGMAAGADTQFHYLAKDIKARIWGHPSVKMNMAAFSVTDFHHIYPPLGMLVRNHHIVNESSILIAAPRQMKEILRSGTWATVRYARKECITTIVVYPDGNHNTFHFVEKLRENIEAATKEKE